MTVFFRHTCLLLLVSTMTLAGCDNAPSGVVGQNRSLNPNQAVLPNVGTIQTDRAERGALFSYESATPEDMFQCQQQCQQGNCPVACQRVFHDYFSRGISPQYHQFMPEVQLFGSLFGNNRGNGYVFDYNQFEMADTQWVNGHRNHLGSTYSSLNDMQGYCNNPSGLVDESVRLSNTGHCNQIDANYLASSTMANNAWNYYINGEPGLAQQETNRLKSFQGVCDGCYGLKYGTPWGKRNISMENKVIKADFKRTWENLLALPENVGLRLGNSILNLAMTRAMIPVAQIEANLAMQTANAQLMLQQQKQMAALAYNSVPIPVYMTGGTCDPYYQQGGVATSGTIDQETYAQNFHNTNGSFVIGEVDSGTGQHIVSCDGSHVQ